LPAAVSCSPTSFEADSIDSPGPIFCGLLASGNARTLRQEAPAHLLAAGSPRLILQAQPTSTYPLQFETPFKRDLLRPESDSDVGEDGVFVSLNDFAFQPQARETGQRAAGCHTGVAWSKTPSMHGHSMRENREIRWLPASDGAAGRIGKAKAVSR